MNEYDLLRAASASHEEHLRSIGLHVTRMPNVTLWAEAMDNLARREKDRGGTAGFPRSYSFNPAYQQESLTADNSFSVAVSDAEVGYVGCIAARRYTGDLKAVALSGGLWVAYHDITECEFEIAGWPSGKEWQLAGPCSQRGGLYVDQDWAGKGVGTALDHIALYDTFLAPDFLDVKHAVGIRRHGEKRRGISERRAYFATAAIGMAQPVKLDLVHISRREAVERARSPHAGQKPPHRLVALHGDGNHQPADATVLPFNRQDQPPVRVLSLPDE